MGQEESMVGKTEEVKYPEGYLEEVTGVCKVRRQNSYSEGNLVWRCRGGWPKRKLGLCWLHDPLGMGEAMSLRFKRWDICPRQCSQWLFCVETWRV